MATKRVRVVRKAEGAYHHGDLKTALKRAALRLVGQKGPRGFSLNEASRLAGVSVAAPYRHFADKDALLAELTTEGNELLARETREAAEAEGTAREAMIAAGMAYLRFARVHADYFAVMFQAGLDKGQYPEVERSAKEAFGVILELAGRYERTAALAELRAISAWALVHGLAGLATDEALGTAAGGAEGIEELRPILERFVGPPYR